MTLYSIDGLFLMRAVLLFELKDEEFKKTVQMTKFRIYEINYKNCMSIIKSRVEEQLRHGKANSKLTKILNINNKKIYKCPDSA